MNLIGKVFNRPDRLEAKRLAELSHERYEIPEPKIYHTPTDETFQPQVQSEPQMPPAAWKFGGAGQSTPPAEVSQPTDNKIWSQNSPSEGRSSVAEPATKPQTAAPSSQTPQPSGLWKQPNYRDDLSDNHGDSSTSSKANSWSSDPNSLGFQISSGGTIGTTVGNNVFRSDGVIETHLGSTSINSDGSIGIISGGTTFNSDGTISYNF